ncbi:MAG: EamA/RhaT family transporter [Neisseria sp.]|nr:EamA/RhaT family transporter [Neisseria sp.]
MWNIVWCVACSVAVSVLLKVARRQKIVLEQAIAMNYIVAAVLCWVLLKPTLPASPATWSKLPWEVFLGLGVLLPSIFVVMGRAVERAGMVRADAAQRLSLFLPIVAAFTVFGERITQMRLIGVVLALVALVCLLIKNNGGKKSGGFGALLLLLGVWCGYGVIDILFKQLARGGAAFADNLFLVFLLALVIMWLYVLLTRPRFNLGSMVGGALLGVLNFFNILFYIKAHQAFHNNPSLVFAAVNVGIIAVATLIGTLLFKEKLNRLNIAGLVLAVCAMAVLFYGNTLLKFAG